MTPFKTIPTYDNGTWTETIFYSREELRDFVRSIFKDAGPDEGYHFDDTSLLFNEEGKRFVKKGYYTEETPGTKEYINYWDTQKKRCRRGVIYKHGDKIWYLTREYYMWLNFLPIYDKEAKKFKFPDIWDGQYHMALYEYLAELEYKHVAVLKKRQYGSSYYHMAKLLNIYWFEKGAVLKIGASLKDYINDKGSWKFINEYRDFLNEYTAWFRNNDPNKPLQWLQRIERRINDRKTYSGLKSSFTGVSFEKNPTSGVGGPVTLFFMEEAGINPTMDTTYEYLRPALQAGMITTGTFIAAGSVGDLEQCKPLKKMMLSPDSYKILSITTNLLDDKGTIGKSALFIPEQWNMLPFIDKYGNSLVEGARAAIIEERIQWKKEMSPEKYQLRISQKPMNVHEAFAFRKVSKFPQNLIANQIKRIEDKEYPIRYVELEKEDTGYVFKDTMKLPIMEVHVKKDLKDKTGVLCITEEPIKNAPWGTYYASIDPVTGDNTTESDSLFAIYVYKNDLQVNKNINGKLEASIERGSIVAWRVFRYDDTRQTNREALKIIEAYNAWTIVERNSPGFITFMQNENKQHYLVPQSQMLFYKDIKAELGNTISYGWTNQGILVSSVFHNYLIEYIKEELDTIKKPDGEVVKTIYGIERIPDVMVLKEMQEYMDKDGKNYDRLVTVSALIAFVKVQEAAMGIRKMDIKTELEKPEKFNIFSMRPFSNIGNSGRFKKRPFKNIR